MRYKLKIFLQRVFFTLLIIIALLVLLIYIGSQHNSDYCIEDGDCYEGRIIKDSNGLEITINKENCLKYGWKWYSDIKMCKVTN